MRTALFKKKEIMADNYLEKQYEKAFGTKKVIKHVGHTLDELLTKNRSTRGYDPTFEVGEDRLMKIVGATTKCASGRNQQVLRYRLVTKDSGASEVTNCIKMGAALPELHLPLPGTAPEAYIVVCSMVEPNPIVYIDLGIAVQTILLRATEMGLNGLCMVAFNKAKLKEALGLPLEPIAVVAIGKSIEKFQLKEIGVEESRNYYREDGVHVVPKVKLADLII